MRDRRGVILLEVLAALTIFACAAVAALGLLSQLTESEQRAEANERTVVDESRLLAAYSLLTRTDLDLRLGRRAVGPYVAEVQRPEPVLYRVAVGDSAGADLVTLLYRAEERADAAR